MGVGDFNFSFYVCRIVRSNIGRVSGYCVYDGGKGGSFIFSFNIQFYEYQIDFVWVFLFYSKIFLVFMSDINWY